MSSVKFAGATIDRHKDSISVEYLDAKVKFCFKLIPNPEGATPPEEWIGSVNNGWVKAHEGAFQLPSDVKAYVNSSGVFFEVPNDNIDVVETLLPKMEKEIQSQNIQYASKMRKKEAAESQKEQKVKELLDRISSK